MGRDLFLIIIDKYYLLLCVRVPLLPPVWIRPFCITVPPSLASYYLRPLCLVAGFFLLRIPTWFASSENSERILSEGKYKIADEYNIDGRFVQDQVSRHLPAFHN